MIIKSIGELLDIGLKINKKLKREKLRLENIENHLIGVSSFDYSKEKVQTSLKESTLKEYLLDDKDSTIKKIQEMETLLDEYKISMKEELNKIEDDETRTILDLKYIKFYPWSLIYELVPYSRTSILRKFRHGKKQLLKNHK